MDLLNAVTQQFLGPAFHERVQLFNAKRMSKNSSQADASEASDGEENPLQSQMRSMVLDIYNEGTTTQQQEVRGSHKPVDSDDVDEPSMLVRRQTGREASKGVESSPSRPPTRPHSVSGLSLTTATFPQTESLPKSSYDVALNASVELRSDSCSVTPRSGSSDLSASHSSLPESLRELNSHLLTSPLTDGEQVSVATGSQGVMSGFRRKLSFDKSEKPMDASVNVFASESASSKLSTILTSQTQWPTKLSVADSFGIIRDKESSDQTQTQQEKLVTGRCAFLPYTPPFSQGVKWASPSSIQTDSVKRKARKAALQLQSLQEESAHLQGKFNSMQREYSQLLEDKTALQSSLAACQAELDISRQKNETLRVEQTELQRAFNLTDSNKKESRVKHQESAGVNESRLSELEKQAMSLRDQNTKLGLQLEQYVTALVSKENRVTELETLLKESRELVATQQSDCSMLSNKLLFHQKKIETLETLRDASEQQIEELRHLQKTMQEERSRLKTEMKSCHDELEQSQSQQLQLELRFSGLQEARMTEKRHMMEILEQISNDWSRHEVAFERAQQEKRGVDKALRDAQKTAKEEKQRLEQMAEQLGSQLEGTTKHLEEQVKSVLQIKFETSKMKKHLDMKEQQCHTAEQRCQEELIKINELERQLQQARNDINEMKLKANRMEKDKSALVRERDINAASHSSQLSIAYQKQQSMEKLIDCKTDNITQKAVELAQIRQQKFAVERELQLTRQREEEARLEREKLKDKLVAVDADCRSKLSAKKGEISHLSSKLEVAYDNINELEGAIKTMKHEAIVRDEECHRLEGVSQKLEEKVSILTDELKRKQHSYRERQLALEQSQVAVEMKLGRLQEQSRLDVTGYHHHQQQVQELQQEISCLQLATKSQELESEQKIEEMKVALELEKGKLAGILDAHSALKQHTSALEAALARRDQSLVYLSAKAKSVLADHEDEEREVTRRITYLEAELVERSGQLDSARVEQSQQRLQIETLQSELVTTTEQSTQMTAAVEQLEKEKDKLSKTTDMIKCNLERTERELKNRDQEVQRFIADLESMKSDLLIKQHEQRSLIDKVESLTWELELKTVECEQKDIYGQKASERHKLEMEEAQKQLEMVKQSNREMIVRLKETWDGRNSLEEEVMRSRDQMALFQLESEATAVDEMELRTEAEIRRQEARSIQERMEKLEIQNDNLRQTASTLLDQCLQARRVPSSKPNLISDPVMKDALDQEADETVMSGSGRLVSMHFSQYVLTKMYLYCRSVTTNLQLCLDLLR